MNKIKSLIKKGWYVEILYREDNDEDSDGWFTVGASHNTWGDVGIHDPDLMTAVNKMHQEVRKRMGVK